MKKLILIAMMTLAGWAQAQQNRLIDAPVNAVVSYFSVLTGYNYVLDFNTSKRTNYVIDEQLSPQQAHGVLVTIMADLGAEVNQTKHGQYVISAAHSAQQQAAKPAVKAAVPTNKLVRVDLANKLDKRSLQNLLSVDAAYAEIKIISDDNAAKSVLLFGPLPAITKLMQDIANLPMQQITVPAPVKQQREPQVTTKVIEPVVDDKKELLAINLSFANAEDVVAALQPMLQVEQVQVSAHSIANQVIYYGPASLREQFMQVVSSLDRKPRQVYVDAIIAEVSEDTSQKLGIQFSAAGGSINASLVSNATNMNLGALAGNTALAGATGGLLAIGDGSLTPDLGAMLSALKADTDNRILATPSLMTMENRESSILVGQNVPFITGQYSSQNSNTATPFQTIKRQDLGTMLKIKPKISPHGDVVMEVWQEVSRLDQTADGLSDVATIKRQISTVVTAQPGETIVIGGLKSEQEEQSVEKVPVLGDIPILGALFRQEGVRSVSRNLVIFLRPKLVTEEESRVEILEGWQKIIGPKTEAYDSQITRYTDSVPVGKRMPAAIAPD